VRRSRASAADMSNTINQVSPIASSTSSNWLKEAQAAIAASESAGGMLGALAASRSQPGSLKAFLAQSQNLANGFSLIAQGNVQSSLDLTFKAATDAYNKRIAERLAAAQARNAQPVNYTPPKGLDSIIYFSDGTTLDTVANIITLSNGKQIDALTGRDYIDESALIRMANGAYIDTKNNVMVMADGTKIDTITGLIITA
jgi:hypothetical protein